MANPIRNAMVFLGLADEDTEFPEEQQGARPVPVASTSGAQRAAVTPIRRSSTPRPAVEMNEILTVHPRAFRDVQLIAEHFRQGVPVIINITQMTDPEARRLLDFTCGLAAALLGHIERVTGKVFLLTPEHVTATGEADEAEPAIEASFFAQD